MDAAEKIVRNAIQRMIDDGLRHYHMNGKVIFKTRKSPSTPWHFFGHDPRMQCALWKWLIYKGVVETTPGLNFVPSPCHDCYKVVVVPNNLKQLQELEQLLSEVCGIGFAGKCGIERRDNGRNYGGYVYCRGKAEAHSRFGFMRDLVPLDIDMHIQHSGTYYIPKQGQSNTWVITDEQLAIEKEVLRLAGTNQTNPDQTPQDIETVHAMWNDWSREHDTE